MGEGQGLITGRTKEPEVGEVIIFGIVVDVINLGGGWNSPSGFGMRIETPLLFFYETGSASAFVPTFVLSVVYRFN